MTFLDAARDYYNRGWTTIPLIPDSNGLPKRPFSAGWQDTPHEWGAIQSLPWNQAQGIGIVLGPVSDNLAVIDIDDDLVARVIFDALIKAEGAKFYYVRTGRNRCHLYFREGVPTAPRTMSGITYGDRTFGVELKGKGQQVAAPPTPGYQFLGTSQEPSPVGTIQQAWDALAAGFHLEAPSGARKGSAGYPSAWQDAVREGNRNNAIYVESCRLAEAGMPVQSAIDTMLARVRQAYDGQISERDIIGTVRSAYRKAHKPLRGWVAI